MTIIIILWKWVSPYIIKLWIICHCISFCFTIISVVFLLTSNQIICSTHLQNVITINIFITTNIYKFFFFHRTPTFLSVYVWFILQRNYSTYTAPCQPLFQTFFRLGAENVFVHLDQSAPKTFSHVPRETIKKDTLRCPLCIILLSSL